MAVGNYRQWVMLRERIEGLASSEPSDDEQLQDKILRFMFRGNTQREKKRRKVVWFILSVLGAAVAGWTGKKIVDRIVERKVRERIGGIESSFTPTTKK